MNCEKCHEHSGHAAKLELHEKRHDMNDIDHREIKTTLDQKIPRWIFLILLGVLLSSFGYQVRVLEVVNSINNNVDIIGERLSNHMIQHPIRKNNASLVVIKDQPDRKQQRL